MITNNIDDTYIIMDDLINKQFTLQRDVLASWNELHKMKLKHEALLSELRNVREQIKYESEPSLFDQLFGEPEPDRYAGPTYTFTSTSP